MRFWTVEVSDLSQPAAFALAVTQNAVYVGADGVWVFDPNQFRRGPASQGRADAPGQ